MLTFLTDLADIFLYPISTAIDYENPLYYGMIAVLVTAGIVSLGRRIFFCLLS